MLCLDISAKPTSPVSCPTFHLHHAKSIYLKLINPKDIYNGKEPGKPYLFLRCEQNQRNAGPRDFQQLLLTHPLFYDCSSHHFKSVFSNNNNNYAILWLPQSPPSLPIIGHIHRLLPPPFIQSFDNLSLKRGSILCLRLGTNPCLLVSASVAYLPPTFSGFINWHSSISNSYTTAGFGNAPYDEYWRFIKSLILIELCGPHQIQRSKAIRREEVGRLIDKIANCLE